MSYKTWTQIAMSKKSIVSICLILIFLWVTQFSSNFKSSELLITSVPEDFEYDGCSMFPDSNYLDCCTAHDTDYFFWWEWQKRLASDNKLMQCVADKGWVQYNAFWALMWVWVRVGWAPIFPTPYRWWFGRDRY